MKPLAVCQTLVPSLDMCQNIGATPWLCVKKLALPVKILCELVAVCQKIGDTPFVCQYWFKICRVSKYWYHPLAMHQKIDLTPGRVSKYLCHPLAVFQILWCHP